MQTPIVDTIAEPPSPAAATVANLTIGQVVALLRICGGMGRQWAEALCELTETYPGYGPQDVCSLAMLGLVYVDKGGPRGTGKGHLWASRVMQAGGHLS